jgi:hypothetical protein
MAQQRADSGQKDARSVVLVVGAPQTLQLHFGFDHSDYYAGHCGQDRDRIVGHRQAPWTGGMNMPIDHLVETGHGRRHAVQDLAQNLHSNETIKDAFIITASVSSI